MKMALPRTKGFAAFTVFMVLLLPMIVFLLFIYLTPKNSPLRGPQSDDENEGKCCKSPALKGYIVLPVSILGPILLWGIIAASVSKKTPSGTQGQFEVSAPSAWKGIMVFGVIVTVFLIIYFSVFGSSGVRNGIDKKTTKTSCEAAGGTWCKSCKSGSSSFVDNFMGCGCGLSTGLISLIVIGVPLLFTIIALIVVYHQKRGISTVSKLGSYASISACGKPFRAAMNSKDVDYIGQVADHLHSLGCGSQAQTLANRMRDLRSYELANAAPKSSSSSTSSASRSPSTPF